MCCECGDRFCRSCGDEKYIDAYYKQRDEEQKEKIRARTKQYEQEAAVRDINVEELVAQYRKEADDAGMAVGDYVANLRRKQEKTRTENWVLQLTDEWEIIERI
jgi:hypothetical protein